MSKLISRHRAVRAISGKSMIDMFGAQPKAVAKTSASPAKAGSPRGVKSISSLWGSASALRHGISSRVNANR